MVYTVNTSEHSFCLFVLLSVDQTLTYRFNLRKKWLEPWAIKLISCRPAFEKNSKDTFTHTCRQSSHISHSVYTAIGYMLPQLPPSSLYVLLRGIFDLQHVSTISMTTWNFSYMNTFAVWLNSSAQAVQSRDWH